jgi:hypothetical protein
MLMEISKSLYRWMARYEAGGLEALAEASHRPKHIPHQMDVRGN